MHLLFVCSHGRHRSVTAARLLAGDGHVTRSAGCDPDAAHPVTEDDLAWADCIYVFERRHRNRLRKQWPWCYSAKSIICLYIADEWEAHDPELMTLIRARVDLGTRTSGGLAPLAG